MISPSLEDMYPFLDRKEFEENMIKNSKNERENYESYHKRNVGGFEATPG